MYFAFEKYTWIVGVCDMDVCVHVSLRVRMVVSLVIMALNVSFLSLIPRSKNYILYKKQKKDSNLSII